MARRGSRLNTDIGAGLYLLVIDGPSTKAGVYHAIGSARGMATTHWPGGCEYTIYRLMTSGNGRAVLVEVEHGQTGKT